LFLTQKTLDKCECLYSVGNYRVVPNPLGENFTEDNWKKEEHQANYLVVNIKTLAIEFAIDQLPSAMEIARRLENDRDPVQTPVDVRPPRYDIQ